MRVYKFKWTQGAHHKIALIKAKNSFEAVENFKKQYIVSNNAINFDIEFLEHLSNNEGQK